MKRMITAFSKRNQLLTKDTTVLIGVSGGPDSMALLHFLLSIQDEWNLTLVVVSADHQLRGVESKVDLQYVRNMCRKWEVKCVEASLDVKSYQESNRVSTQVAAREARYQFFSEQMEYFHADYLALGHHGDDQVETMLMGFVRSASTTALSGIPVKRRFATGSIVRPLLCVTKAAIIDYCEANQIVSRIDPSNENTDYTRSYFRKYVIPIISKKNRNIHTTAQRLSESLHEDERYMQDEAKKLVEKVVDFDKELRSASFDIEQFKSYRHALQRRAYQLVLNCLYNILPKNFSYVQEEIFFALLEESQSNVKLDFPHDLKIEKSYQKVTFYFLGQNIDPLTFDELLSVPGELTLPNGSQVTAIYTDNLKETNEHTYLCATDQVVLPLHIRTRQPGDRMSWKGLKGSKKIKAIFIDAKIPHKDRTIWPIVTDDQENILWLIGLRKGHQEIKSKGKPKYIQLEYREGEE